MLNDTSSLPAGTRLDADVCIIGAGAVGIAIAREFFGTSTTVLVLESGKPEYDAPTQEMAAGENVGLPYFPLDTTRLRWLGGTTNHYGGVTRRMSADDLQKNPVAPHSGWPLTAADLNAFYERARILCGLPYAEGELPSLLKRDRYPALPLAPERFGTVLGQIVPQEARSFRLAYQKDLEHSSNVSVHCGANVTEIETNANGSEVTRVHAATLGGNRFTITARRFILAAGGIENARLLLVSSRQWAHGVGNQHDRVGRFFMEHPRFAGGIIVPTRPNTPLGLYQHHRLGRTGVQGYLAIHPDLRRQEGLVDVQMVVRPAYVGSFERATRSSTLEDARALAKTLKRRKDLDQLGKHLAVVARDLMSWQSVAIPGAPLPVPFPELVGQLMRSTPPEAQALVPGVLGDIVATAYAKAVGAPLDHIIVRTRIDAAPNPDSRVTLSPERDALGMPKTRLDWRLSPIDHHSVRRTLELLGAEVGRAGMGRLRILLDDDESVWPSDLAGGYHHMGTTRMSDDPKLGVVDRNARVHSISNLYIAGSSVFPSGGSGTPTLTAVALALRLADHLKGGSA